MPISKAKDANIQKRDKIARVVAHIWRRNGDLHNIGPDNLELICDDCYSERKTTK